MPSAMFSRATDIGFAKSVPPLAEPETDGVLDMRRGFRRASIYLIAASAILIVASSASAAAQSPDAVQRAVTTSLYSIAETRLNSPFIDACLQSEDATLRSAALDATLANVTAYDGDLLLRAIDAGQLTEAQVRLVMQRLQGMEDWTAENWFPSTREEFADDLVNRWRDKAYRDRLARMHLTYIENFIKGAIDTAEEDHEPADVQSIAICWNMIMQAEPREQTVPMIVSLLTEIVPTNTLDRAVKVALFDRAQMQLGPLDLPCDEAGPHGVQDLAKNFQDLLRECEARRDTLLKDGEAEMLRSALHLEAVPKGDPAFAKDDLRRLLDLQTEAHGFSLARLASLEVDACGGTAGLYFLPTCDELGQDGPAARQRKYVWNQVMKHWLSDCLRGAIQP